MSLTLPLRWRLVPSYCRRSSTRHYIRFIAYSSNGKVLDRHLRCRLWHQLTEQVKELFAVPEARPGLPVLLTRFVSLWDRKINPLVHVKLAIAAARQLPTTEESIALLKGILESKTRSVGQQQPLFESERLPLETLLKMELAGYALKQGNLAAALESIEECAPLVDSYVAVDPLIPGTFYRVRADYAKVQTSKDGSDR